MPEGEEDIMVLGGPAFSGVYPKEPGGLEVERELKRGVFASTLTMFRPRFVACSSSLIVVRSTEPFMRGIGDSR